MLGNTEELRDERRAHLRRLGANLDHADKIAAARTSQVEGQEVRWNFLRRLHFVHLEQQPVGFDGCDRVRGDGNSQQ